MEDLYSIHPGIAHSDDAAVGTMSDSDSTLFHTDASSAAALHRKVHGGERVPRELLGASTSSASDLSDVVKTQISRHPRFPALVSAYIDCRKVKYSASLFAKSIVPPLDCNLRLFSPGYYYTCLLCRFSSWKQVGAPPEVASLLEEIRRGNYPIAACSEVGTDPELDEFMVTVMTMTMTFIGTSSKN